MLFWIFVGSVFSALLIVAIEEKIRAKGLTNRLGLAVANHHRNNSLSKYHEPTNWRR